jgi:hypothetical protein
MLDVLFIPGSFSKSFLLCSNVFQKVFRTTKWFYSVLLLLKSDLDFAMRNWSFDFKTGIRPLME